MNLFKNLAMVGLVSVGILSKALCADSEDADLKMWQEKAAAIKPGTPLSEVKKTLGINPNSALSAYCSGSHCSGLVLVQSNITACIDWQGGPDFPNDPVNHVSVRSGPVFTEGTKPAGSKRLPNAFHGNAVEIECAPVTEGDVMRKMMNDVNRPSPTPQ